MCMNLCMIGMAKTVDDDEKYHTVLNTRHKPDYWRNFEHRKLFASLHHIKVDFGEQKKIPFDLSLCILVWSGVSIVSFTIDASASSFVLWVDKTNEVYHEIHI